MAKKCVICDAEAEFFVKGIPNDRYCRECAEENFNDLELLEKVSSEKEKIKKDIEDKLPDTGGSEESREEE